MSTSKVTSPLELDNPPEEIDKIGREAVALTWKFAAQLIEKNRIDFVHQLETKQTDFVQQLHSLQKSIHELKQQRDECNTFSEQLKRQVKNTERELQDKIVHIGIQRDNLAQAQAELQNKNQDIRQLVEQRGRLTEAVDRVQKQLEVVEHECRNKDAMRQEVQMEATLHAKERERLDARLKEAVQEHERLREKLKKEQTQLALANSQVEELRSNLQRVRDEADFLRRENQERQDVLATEMKARVEAEKKAAGLEARLFNVEKSAKETYIKLEQELTKVRAEGLALRDRMIKAEGEAERQKHQNEIQETKWLKSIERMEFKLQQMESKLQAVGVLRH